MITSGASLARHGRMKDHPGGSGANAIDKAMKEPRDFARDAGRFAIPDGSGDRFSGYAVIGLPFSSGHILALRCFEASSLGAYTSVWHRDPKGRWTFHQNVPPEQSCPRYFGAAISENTIEAIRIEWDVGHTPVLRPLSRAFRYLDAMLRRFWSDGSSGPMPIFFRSHSELSSLAWLLRPWPPSYLR